jgi:hypothetical protein
MSEGMPNDGERAQAAVDRLSDAQRILVGACLRAIVDGPYVADDGEFQTIMGVTRPQTAAVASTWPDFVFVAVSNTLNNLLGYPHKRWPQLSEEIGADSRRVEAALATWRGQDLNNDPGLRYFEPLE